MPLLLSNKRIQLTINGCAIPQARPRLYVSNAVVEDRKQICRELDTIVLKEVSLVVNGSTSNVLHLGHQKPGMYIHIRAPVPAGNKPVTLKPQNINILTKPPIPEIQSS
jgi:hypothetical protein